ncbi:uncharacterized protein CBL_02573 [Carabus blaptoides fortunei]
MSNSQVNPAFVADEEKGGARKTKVSAVEFNATREKGDDYDYNPYEHRMVSHPTTNAETLLHLLKGSLGTGILAMPKAFLNAGYVIAIVGTILIGGLCLYCIHMLINAEYELCKRKKVPSMNYPTTAKIAMSEGPPILQKCAGAAPHIVNGFLLFYQLGTMCVYTVFIAQNIKDVVDEYLGEEDIRLYMLVLLLPLILINWVRNLKYLAPFSTLANVITVVSFGVIIYYLFAEGPTFEKREPVGEVQNMPLFLGTVLFALEAIGVIMPLENEMKTPESFGGKCGVLNIAMFIIIVLYVFMGFLGYLAYGADVNDSITLSLKRHEVLGQVVRITLAVAIYITHGLQGYVAFDITWNGYLKKRTDKNSHPLLWEYVLRTCLVIFTFLLAVAIPRIGMLISLVGAFCLSALGLAFPAIIEISTYYYTYTGSRFKWMMSKNSLLIIFAIFGLIVGTYTSIHEIVNGFTL